MGLDRRSWLAILMTVTLLVLCLAPKSAIGHEQGPRLPPHTDKIIHFGMFLAFASAWMWAARSRRATALVLAAVLILAVGTELAQGLPVVNRDPDPWDATADIAGGLAGLVAVQALPRRREALAGPSRA